MTTPSVKFCEQLQEITEGRRGFISLPHFTKVYGGKLHKHTLACDLAYIARESGFEVKVHGALGYCVFKKAAA